MAALALWGTLAAHAQAAPPCPPDAVGCHAEAVGWDAMPGLFMGSEVDTGWVPGGSPLQVRIIMDLVADADVTLSATAGVWWPMPLTVGLDAGPGAGSFTTSYRFLVEVQVRLHDDWFGGGTLFSASLPVFDFDAEATAPFDSLAFADEPAATTDAELGPLRVFEYGLTDLLGALGVSIPGVVADVIDANVYLDVSAPMTATYTTSRVVADDGAGALGSLAGVLTLGPELGGSQFGASRDVALRPEGQVEVVASVELTPGVQLEAFGSTVTGWSVPIPFEVSDMSTAAAFEERTVHVPLPDVHAAPRTLDFAQVQVGDADTLVLSVHNAGEATLTVTVAPPGAPFTVDATELSVSPGQTRKLFVGFEPTDLGEARATLRLATNDPDLPLVRVPMVGNGAEPLPMADAGAADAGSYGATPQHGGCGCRTVAPRRDAPGALLLVAAVALWLTRRRRRLSGR